MDYFKFAIPIVAFLTALGLSISSAYISILGLMYIFSGIFVPFILIEIAKIVSTLILHKHWNHNFGLVKFGLIIAVVISMAVTSMGVFGYLSKASTEGKESITVNSSKLDSLNLSVERKQSSLDRNINQIDKYNDMLSKLITDNPTKAQRERKNIQNQISELEKENKLISLDLDKLNDEIVPYKKELSKHEVEIGPLLYVTKLIYKDDYKLHSEDALIYLIIVLMFIIDPFAIMLLIASQKSFEHVNNLQKQKIEPEAKKEVHIDEFGIPIEEEIKEEVLSNDIQEPNKFYPKGRVKSNRSMM